MRKDLVIIVGFAILSLAFLLIWNNKEASKELEQNYSIEELQNEFEKKIESRYPFVQNVDSVVIKLSRYDWDCGHSRLMSRFVFDYFFERIWEESGKVEQQFYVGEQKENIIRIIKNCKIMGVTPDFLHGNRYKNICLFGDYYDDINIVAKIEFFVSEKLVNVLWCSHHFMDGMEEYNYPIRKIISKDLKAELDRIHNN